MSDTSHLGAATESLLASAFSSTATITAKAAAQIVGIDAKTLRALADEGVIGSVPGGAKNRRYTEAGIRGYLAGERPKENETCRSTGRRNRATSNTTSPSRVVAFTARPASKRAAPRSR